MPARPLHRLGDQLVQPDVLGLRSGSPFLRQLDHVLDQQGQLVGLLDQVGASARGGPAAPVRPFAAAPRGSPSGWRAGSAARGRRRRRAGAARRPSARAPPASCCRSAPGRPSSSSLSTGSRRPPAPAPLAISSVRAVNRRIGASEVRETRWPSTAASTTPPAVIAASSSEQTVRVESHLVQRAGHLHRAAAGQRRGEHAQVIAVHGLVLERGAGVARGDRRVCAVTGSTAPSRRAGSRPWPSGPRTGPPRRLRRTASPRRGGAGGSERERRRRGRPARPMCRDGLDRARPAREARSRPRRGASPAPRRRQPTEARAIATATAAAAASDSRRRDGHGARAARSRPRARSGSAAARRPPRAFAAGSPRRRRASSTSAPKS